MVGDRVGVAGLRLDGAEEGPVIVVVVADELGQVGGRGSIIIVVDVAVDHNVSVVAGM